MATFESAIAFLLGNEGGFSDHPADAGGATNYGISLRFLRTILPERLKRYGIFEAPDISTIANLTIDQAKLIYRGEFWEAAPFEKIMNQVLANYIFDMVVNHGMAQAIKMTQRSIWACQKQRDFIKDDGILGSKTLQAINQASFMLKVALVAQRDAFVRSLDKREFLDGWLNRVYQ